MQVTIDADKCNGCGVCVRICPQKILTIQDEKSSVVNADKCIGCFSCEDNCPTEAIRVIRYKSKSPEFEQNPPLKDTFDVVIVGAGPAGISSAIKLADSGFSVGVFDRLPNSKISSHPDAGLIFPIGNHLSFKIVESGVYIPQLDTKFTCDSIRRPEFLGIIGPEGVSTKLKIPKGIDVWSIDKDRFLAELIIAAKKKGVDVYFNTKVVDVIKEGNQIIGIKLADGNEVRGKVTILAEGIIAKLSSSAGVSIDKNIPWYAYIVCREYELKDKLPAGLYYIYGGLEYLDEPFRNSSALAVGITDKIHIYFMTFVKERIYPSDIPIDRHLDKVIEKDKRISEIVGYDISGLQSLSTTGCRVAIREKPTLNPVVDGAVSIGDTLTNAGELGNTPAMLNGIMVADVIIQAIKRNDFSSRGLGASREFINNNHLLTIMEKNRNAKLMPTVYSNEDMRKLFVFLKHMNYSTLLFGSSISKVFHLIWFLFSNLFNFIRYPSIGREVLRL